MSGSKILLNLIKFSKKNYNEESDKGYFLEADVQYTKKLYELHNDLPFLAERMKIVEKLVANLHDKTKYEIKEEVNSHKKFKTSVNSWISF